eukprot:5702948-Pyramimonas_sp.AAC.1
MGSATGVDSRPRGVDSRPQGWIYLVVAGPVDMGSDSSGAAPTPPMWRGTPPVTPLGEYEMRSASARIVPGDAFGPSSATWHAPSRNILHK